MQSIYFLIFLLHTLPSFQIVGDDNLTPLGTIGPSMGFRVLDADAYLVLQPGQGSSKSTLQ